MFNQFANVPPPSSIANLPGLETVFEPRSTASQQFHQDPSVNLLDFIRYPMNVEIFFKRFHDLYRSLKQITLGVF